MTLFAASRETAQGRCAAAGKTLAQRPCHRARGVGLIDALIALAILAFGLLALTRFQGRITTQSTDAQWRSTANRLADELISLALLDPDNLGCYTLPAAGTCGSALARGLTDGWLERVSAALPLGATASVTANGSQLVILITWKGKDDADADRRLTVTTDVQR